MSISAIAFILIFFGGCLASLLATPFYGILLYAFEYFLNPASRWWYVSVPNLRFSLVTMIVIVVGFFLKRTDFKDNRILAVPQTKWVLLLCLAVFCSSFWAVDPFMYGILSGRFYKYIIFVFFLYKIIDSPKRMEWFLSIYCLGIFYISWIGWQMGRTGNGRLEGIGSPDSPDVNTAAAMVVTAVPLLLFYVLYGKNKWFKGGALVGLAFVLNCLVLMGSRGAFLGLAACAVYFSLYALSMAKVSLSVKVKIVFGFAGGIALFVYLADAFFWERIVTLTNIDPEEGSGRRVNFWMATFDMLAHHPLGLGGGGYEYLSPQYLPAEWMAQGSGGGVGRRAVHSIWFEVLADLGYHGILIFAGYILSNFLLLRRLRKYLIQQGRDVYYVLQSVALEAAFVAFLVASTFINRFYSEILYWLPAMIAAYANIYMLKPQSVALVENARELSEKNKARRREAHISIGKI